MAMAHATGPKLFTKELTMTDVDHSLNWPSEYLRHLPDFNGAHQVEFVGKDITGKRWNFRCSKRKKGPYRKPVVSGGWLPFLRGGKARFKAGDEVVVYRSLDPDAHFAIRMKRKVLLFGANINDVEE